VSDAEKPVVVVAGEDPDDNQEAVAEIRVMINDHRVVAAVGVALCFSALALPKPETSPWLSPALALCGLTVGAGGALRWPRRQIDIPDLEEWLARIERRRLVCARLCWTFAILAAWAWYLSTFACSTKA
jgi:hypothetical protein